ncbi:MULTISPECIES: hypothetical protein [Streptomyces]|nr:MULTISPECIES: hypothetical protein [unclassified Streptomyces]
MEVSWLLGIGWRDLRDLLVSLHTVTSSAPDGSGDHELAATLYGRSRL